MSKRPRCKICKVETEVNEHGRCRSCQAAYEATEVYHTTYGKHQAQKEWHDQIKQPTPLPPGWKTCPKCGKRFYANHGKRIYCSDLCAREAKQNRRRERQHQQPVPSKICAACGKEFIPSRNDKRIKYCSIECCEVAAREIRRSHGKGKRNADTGTVQSDPVAL